MKDELVNVVKASWPYVLTLVMELYLVGSLPGTVMALSKYKLTATVYLSAVLKQLVPHLWQDDLLYLSQKNPISIIAGIGVILYTLYLALKYNSQHKSWQTADTETHGSATLGNSKDRLVSIF